DEFKVAMEALRKSPDDPAACLTVGRHLCLVKGDWTTGLPLLAKGADAKLKALGQLELASPTDPAAQLKLADGWWESSTSTSASSHAALWYAKAAPGLSGASRARASSRGGAAAVAAVAAADAL